MTDSMACGVATPNPLVSSSSTHHWQCSMCLVWSKSVKGTNSCYHYNHRVNEGFLMRALSANRSACDVGMTQWSTQPQLFIDVVGDF
jgi:hypothetical protein